MAADLVALLTAATFSTSEAKVYLAGLELGAATLLDIARRSGVSKTSTFEALESLERQKLVRGTKRKGRAIYRFADAEHVVDTLRSRVADQAATIDNVVRALPLFSALCGNGASSTIIHEGIDAIHGYFSHLEKTQPESIDEIANPDDVYAWIDAKELLKARKAYKWMPKKARALFVGTPKNKNPRFVHRLLNPAWGTFRGNLAMYGNFVSVLTFTTRPITIIIESKPLADSLRLLFNVAWRASDDPK
jgi:predicted transcriptional regulator